MFVAYLLMIVSDHSFSVPAMEFMHAYPFTVAFSAVVYYAWRMCVPAFVPTR